MRAAPHPTDVQVGKRLREQRTLRGLSQERLARLIGVTYQQVQKYERGTNRIGSSRLDAIARILAVPIGFFFDEDATTATQDGGRTDGGVIDLAAMPGLAAAPVGQVGRRETLELVRAFNQIDDPQVRRRMLELARALAAAAWRGDGHRSGQDSGSRAGDA